MKAVDKLASHLKTRLVGGVSYQNYGKGVLIHGRKV